MFTKDYLMTSKNVVFFLLIFSFSFFLTGTISDKETVFILTVNDLPDTVLVGTEVEVVAELKNTSLFIYDISYGADPIFIYIESESRENLILFSVLTTGLVLPKEKFIYTRALSFEEKGTYIINVISQIEINGRMLEYKKSKIINVV